MKDLEFFLKKCKQISQKQKKPLFFLLAFTSKAEKCQYYVTPFREFNDFNLAGIIIFQDLNLKKIINLAKKYSHKIVLDLERKTKNSSDIFYKSIKLINNPKKIFFIKTNDLTLDSAFNYILHMFNQQILIKKRITILFLGMGNIGSKLSLKLLESNFDILVKSRNKKKDNLTIRLIKNIKLKYNRSSIRYYNNSYSKKINAIINLVPSENKLINLELINNLTQCKVVIDVGKSGFDYSLINSFTNKKINYFRLDPESGFQSAISSYLHFKNRFLKKIGKKKYNNRQLVSGGIIGEAGSLVTDNIKEPNFIYGELNHTGGFLKRYIKKFINS